MTSEQPNAIKLLNQFSLRRTRQRVLILEYLIQNQSHPAIDDIYRSVRTDIPGLSKTTIYNVLESFMQSGLVRSLSIEPGEMRYDIVTGGHGHFMCSACGAISNFTIDIDQFTTQELKNFRIEDRQVYFKGICPDCLGNNRT